MTGWVLATRNREQLADLNAVLAPHQLEAVPFPVLCEVDQDDPVAWAGVASRVGDLEVLALTSPRAAEALLTAAASHALREPVAALPVAAIGEATAAAARTAGLTVAVTGAGGGGELADRILGHWGGSVVVLHACGRDRRPELAERLAAAGATLVEVPVYAVDFAPVSSLPTLPPTLPVAVVLSSPRAAEAYLEAVGDRFLDVPHVAFGEATAAAARRLGVADVRVSGPEARRVMEEICQIC